MCNAHKSRPGRYKSAESLHIKLSAVCNRYHLEAETIPLGLQLPGHYVAMVLHTRNDDLITLLYEGTGE